VVPGCNNVIGTKFRGQINVSYSVESGIVHTMFGELATKVESGNATSVSGPFTVAFRESGNEQNRTDDSQISADNPTTNYGALTTINVDGSGPHVHGLIRFPNIFGASQGQVPLGAQIQTATITIECFGTGHTMNAYRLLESWTESEVTWNERSTGTAWSDVGADGPGSRDTTAISWLCDSAGSKNYDMTSFVQSWSSGNPNYGVVITDSGNNGNDLYSNERATESERPLLTVTYTVTS
ncbi:TPA: DNRLRE domain-containing protein, partial [Candidatus Woesearchaeota archaeon]|nr:DNRLRE domain-containing protein [Candidatus Woesearchaeota archaeon]